MLWAKPAALPPRRSPAFWPGRSDAVAEPMSDERLEELRNLYVGDYGVIFTDVRDLYAEVVRLRAALEHAERVAADRLAEDEKYLTGWKDARDKAAKSLYGMVGDGAGAASKAIFACAEIIREMQPWPNR
jgi:hypothetical protein